jgi:molecular chaperone DnaJ
MHDPKGYYNLLNLTTESTPDEIKKSYRDLMKKYHPDINSTPEAVELSKQINEAYSVLSNEELKREYDQSYQGSPGFNPFAAPDFSRFFSFINMGISDPPRANSDLRLDVTINAEELFSDNEYITISYSARNFCGTCNGVGYSEWEICGHCNGVGQMIENNQQGQNFMQFITPCQSCRGTGKNLKNLCKDCEGFSGTEEKKQVNIPNNSSVYFKTLRFSQQGSKDVNVSDPAGDLFLTITPAINNGSINPNNLDIILRYDIDALFLITESESEIIGINKENHKINLNHNSLTYIIEEKGIPLDKSQKRSNLVIQINPILRPIDDEDIRKNLSNYIKGK